MSSVNKVILIGNLGKSPEVRNLENGNKVASFPLATSENYKDKNGNKVDNTEWHNLVLWNGLAEVSEKYLNKGDKIYVEGKLKTRQWQDKDGNTRYTTEVVANQMTMLSGPNKTDNSAEIESVKAEEVPSQEEDDSLPF